MDIFCESPLVMQKWRMVKDCRWGWGGWWYWWKTISLNGEDEDDGRGYVGRRPERWKTETQAEVTPDGQKVEAPDTKSKKEFLSAHIPF